MVNLSEVIDIYSEQTVTEQDIKKSIHTIYKKHKVDLKEFKVLTLERLLKTKISYLLDINGHIIILIISLITEGFY